MVLGANGFIGRHVVRALHAQGMAVVGVRRVPPAAPSDADETGPIIWKHLQLHTLREPDAWREHLEGIDVVINCVGILRQRFGERYDDVHHLMPKALAAACAASGVRLIHTSALGLHEGAKSRFLKHAEQPVAPALQVMLPDWMSRTGAHLCDLFRFSPFSYGHWILLQRDNMPVPNALPQLLGRALLPVTHRRVALRDDFRLS
jgi:NAD dependent epimerase/dehydratase family enzyme